jgi:hypothetical protein
VAVEMVVVVVGMDEFEGGKKQGVSVLYKVHPGKQQPF